MGSRACVLLALAGLLLCARAHGGVDHNAHGYRYGMPLQIECRSPNSTAWDRQGGILCTNAAPGTGPALVSRFNFGVDAFFVCSWPIPAAQVPFLTRCINREESLRCRALMIPGHEFWIPFDLPIWGVVEDSHIHVDNHVNFIFHAARGSLLAVAAYPLRDQVMRAEWRLSGVVHSCFSLIQFAYVDNHAGGVVQMHGSIKFFNGESFQGVDGVAFLPQDPNAPKSHWGTFATVFVWSFLAALVTAFVALFVYLYRLQPAMQRKLELAKID